MLSASRITTNVQPPQAFICTHSKRVMEDPVLALCGHLFERSVAYNLKNCPIDSYPINPSGCITCKELADRIKTWKEGAANETKTTSTYSYAATVASSSSSSSSSSRPGQPVIEKGKKPLNFLSSMASALPPAVPTEAPPQITRRHIVKNAHFDDIHGLAHLSGNRFVSGSKDNSLKIWDHQGNELQKITPAAKGYAYWVTALTKFTNNLWASGTRDGSIAVWNEQGQIMKQFDYRPSEDVKNDTRSKDRNKERINCIVEESSDATRVRFYTGTPKYIHLWDGLSGGLIYEYQVHKNDWVYCIQPLEGKKLIVVIGSDMELWQMNDDGLGVPKRSMLVKESAHERFANQRPHISAIQQVEKRTNLLASAFFDGSVRVVDIEKQTVVLNWQEHIKRVWSVINIQDNVIASSADDATIKLWDIRKPKSVMTLDGNPGRVSSLLKLTDAQFISGSCPDKVFTSREKASITFWDIRK